MNVKKKKYITIFFTLLQQSKPEKKKKTKHNKTKESKVKIKFAKVEMWMTNS